MRKVKQQLANQLTYAAGTPATPVSLPNEQVITSLDLDWDINANVASGFAYNGQAVAKSTWNQFSIQGGPSYFVNLTDPVLLLAQNKMLLGNVLKENVATANTNPFTTRFMQRFHFGSDEFGAANLSIGPYDPFDKSAGIIGPNYSKGGLVLSCTFPANTVQGTNITILTTTFGRIIVHGLLATPAELVALGKSMAQPMFTETDIQLSAIGSQTGLAGRQDLPTGQNLRAINMYLADNGAGAAQAQDDTRLTQIGIAVSGEQDRRLVYSDWYNARNSSATRLGNPIVSSANTDTAGVVDAGFARFDLRLLTDLSGAPMSNQYGLNLEKEQAGNYQLAMSVVTANGALKCLFEQFKVQH